MAVRDELLNRLKRLSSSQFDEMLFRLHIDVSDLPGPEVSQTQRAIELIRRLEQEESGFQHLQELLDDLAMERGVAPGENSENHRARPFLSALFAGRNFRRYLRNLVEYHQRFSLLGKAKAINLEEIYIPLRLREHVPPDLVSDTQSGAPNSVRASRLSASMGLLEALVCSRRLVILGHPGSGKTTLLKYLLVKIAQRDRHFIEFARHLIPQPIPTFLCCIARGLEVPTLIITLVALAVAAPYFLLHALPADYLGIILFAVVNFVGSYLIVEFRLYPIRVIPGRVLYSVAQRLTRYPLPVFVTLNDFAKTRQVLSDCFVECVKQYGFKHAENLLKRKLNKGECLLLLDGLDEIADEALQSRITQKIDSFIAEYGQRNQILVTTRIAGYRYLLHGFEHYEVAEFEDEQVNSFAGSWFAQAPGKAENFLRDLARSERLKILTENPLLLSITAIVYEQNWQLPERRSDLYDECVKVLLEKWDEFRRVHRKPRFSAEIKRKILQQVAVKFHEGKKVVFSRKELSDAVTPLLPWLGVASTRSEEFVDEVLEHTGLLRQKSRTTYDFIHLTFQEYFTAEAYHENGDADALLSHLADVWWEEVIVLYAAILQDATALIETIAASSLFASARCLIDARSVSPRARMDLIGKLRHVAENIAMLRQKACDMLGQISDEAAAGFLGNIILTSEDEALRLAATLGLGMTKDSGLLERFLVSQTGRTLQFLHGTLRQADAATVQRILALLERLGYPMVYIPAGEFLMGSKKRFNEQPQRQVYLDAFFIDKYLVTNAQYARFIAETGHSVPPGWMEGASLSNFPPTKWRYPEGKDEYPVADVTWDGAIAYCQWVGKQLPTEAQWEKAARGTDGREYPWGDEWDRAKCCCAQGGAKGTTPVGKYPEGVSPYGCYDVVGNVQEWCADWYNNEYYRTAPNRNPCGPVTGENHVARGGSWAVRPRYLQLAYRSHGHPEPVGFRCVLTSANSWFL